MLKVGVRDRHGNRDGGGVRRAELEEKVSAMKRGDAFAEIGSRGLPDLLRPCLLGGKREDLSVALPGSRCTLWPISARCCGIV